MTANKGDANQKSKRPDDRIEVENVNVPGSRSHVNGAKYRAMRQALLELVPRRAPGLTQNEMIRGVRPYLPEDLFPGGSTSAWWVKCVQLDLEAKRLLTRDGGKPLRWRRI